MSFDSVPALGMVQGFLLVCCPYGIFFEFCLCVKVQPEGGDDPAPLGGGVLEGGDAVCYLWEMKGNIRYWLFDLDNTLYPAASGLFGAIDHRINRYLQKFFDIRPERSDYVRRDYFHRYGLTLLGLMEERGADPEHYLEYVHRVPVADYLSPNSRLQALLAAIPVPKVIFTNGSRRHSMAVMEALGVSDAFDEIFDIASCGYIPKPDLRSYRMVLERLGIAGREALMAEDLERNLPPAKSLGMVTVLVGGSGGSRSADYSVATIEEIAGDLSEIHP
jgi:putative hydrolase of the HAD superfamily